VPVRIRASLPSAYVAKQTLLCLGDQVGFSLKPKMLGLGGTHPQREAGAQSSRLGPRPARLPTARR
jgi:hypothetical protein